VIRSHPLTRDVPKAQLDAVLAAIAGFFTTSSLLAPPPGLPTVRSFQRSQAVSALSWLRRRLELEQSEWTCLNGTDHRRATSASSSPTRDVLYGQPPLTHSNAPSRRGGLPRRGVSFPLDGRLAQPGDRSRDRDVCRTAVHCCSDAQASVRARRQRFCNMVVVISGTGGAIGPRGRNPRPPPTRTPSWEGTDPRLGLGRTGLLSPVAPTCTGRARRAR